MSFGTSNVRRGTSGDIKITAGDWTGSQNDASGTFNVEGGRVYSATFNINSTTSPTISQAGVTWTAPTGTTTTTTVTVHYHEPVTAGTFIIHHA